MVKLIIGDSGSGKTYILQESLLHDRCKAVYVIEDNTHKEYSRIFSKDYISVLNWENESIEQLQNIKGSAIIIDCGYYSEKNLEVIEKLVRTSRINNNDIFIAFLDLPTDSQIFKNILCNTTDLMVGNCFIENVDVIENCFGIVLNKELVNRKISKWHFQKFKLK